MVQRILNCMMQSAIGYVAAGIAVAFIPSMGFAETVDPSELSKPNICPPYFVYDNVGLKCMAGEGIDKLDPKGCANDFINVVGNVCVPNPANQPKPQCKPLSGYTPKMVGGACQYEKSPLATSYQGDYVGDCFTAMAPIDGTSILPGGEYFVSRQTASEKDDPELILVEGKKWGSFEALQKISPIIGCGPQQTSKPPIKVSASLLAGSGAIRRGFAYGFLTMPYKYYPSNHEFSAGLPLGGYLGWRVGQPGAGGTFAAAMTVSSVKADVIDPNTAKAEKPTITGSTDAMALSGAIGFVFDVAKSPGGRAFKSGIFVGKDYVNADPSIVYKYNKKTWVAIQFGFDFTDN
ncbi:MAG: hypothetical protein RLY71_593 [Pseudomonadota bacterium]|jgi:hypothetical protein